MRDSETEFKVSQMEKELRRGFWIVRISETVLIVVSSDDQIARSRHCENFRELEVLRSSVKSVQGGPIHICSLLNVQAVVCGLQVFNKPSKDIGTRKPLLSLARVTRMS